MQKHSVYGKLDKKAYGNMSYVVLLFVTVTINLIMEHSERHYWQSKNYHT